MLIYIPVALFRPFEFPDPYEVEASAERLQAEQQEVNVTSTFQQLKVHDVTQEMRCL
jgi:hypothetical protein